MITTSIDQDKNIKNNQTNQEINDPILCDHCKRTATNGIKCKGICVADNGY